MNTLNLDPKLVVLDLSGILEKIKNDPDTQIVLRHVSAKALVEACVVEPVYHPTEDIDPDFDILRKTFARRTNFETQALNRFDDTCASIADELENHISFGITYKNQPDSYRFLRWLDDYSALFQYMPSWEMPKDVPRTPYNDTDDIPF